ncbi:type II toxin-antitoxin system PemK/MazF family toxin [Paenibacillus sp. FSL H3-0286]|uniref:type II toxin-antitoxin system PemK/MazF family toxin n=1 Tax=Paenibacillus sp. FSL H3-0286 TaxID=2921427 RepID=UPI0032450C8E
MSMVMEATANKIVRKDEIWLADLGESKGSVQGGVRPILIVSNDIGNKFSPVVSAVSITSSTTKKNIPTHVKIVANDLGFKRDSVILCEQDRTIGKDMLIHKIADLPESYFELVDAAVEMVRKRIKR